MKEINDNEASKISKLAYERDLKEIEIDQLGAQKEEFNRQIKQDLEFVKLQLETYLKHSYVIYDLPNQHHETQERFKNHFSEKARNAIMYRFTDNQIIMELLNNKFNDFVEGMSMYISHKSR